MRSGVFQPFSNFCGRCCAQIGSAISGLPVIRSIESGAEIAIFNGKHSCYVEWADKIA